VAKKLGLSDGEFDAIMNAERKTFWDYPSSERDLPGTPLYTRYIKASHFHSGEWTRQQLARIDQRRQSMLRLPSRLRERLRRLRQMRLDPAAAARRTGRIGRRITLNAASGLLRRCMMLTVPLIRPAGALARRTLSPEGFSRLKAIAQWLYAGGRLNSKP